MSKKDKYYQQGDVLIKPGKVPTDAKVENSLVLAEGEVTGHAHRVVEDWVKDMIPALGKGASTASEPPVQLFKRGDDLYVRALKEWEIRHEEHKPITVPPGEYKIDRVREYHHFEEEARQVAD